MPKAFPRQVPNRGVDENKVDDLVLQVGHQIAGANNVDIQAVEGEDVEKALQGSDLCGGQRRADAKLERAQHRAQVRVDLGVAADRRV